jgi:hypothetical protein
MANFMTVQLSCDHRVIDGTPRASRLAPRASRLAPRTSHLAPRASRLAPRASRLAPRASRLAPRASRLAPPAVLATSCLFTLHLYLPFLGAIGARWLQAFKKCVDDPLKMLL